MSALIEVRVPGDRRAFIEAGSIAGIVTSPGGRADVVATQSTPLAVILRGGETLEIYGESAAMLIVRAARIRKIVREENLDIKCDMLDAIADESSAHGDATDQA